MEISKKDLLKTTASRMADCIGETGGSDSGNGLSALPVRQGRKPISPRRGYSSAFMPYSS